MRRSENRYVVVALVAHALLARGAWSADERRAEVSPMPTAADLQMPATAFADVAEVSTRALAVDDGRQGATPPEITALRRIGLASAAQYRYRIAGERPAQLKVRVDVFPDETAAKARFRGRHLPQALAMTEPLAAGDDGFIYRDQFAGFRVGPVTVEIRAAKPGGRLAEFARSYADFVAARLRGKALSSPPPPGNSGPP